MSKGPNTKRPKILRGQKIKGKASNVQGLKMDKNVGFTKVCFKLWVFYLFCKEGKEMVVSFLQ